MESSYTPESNTLTMTFDHKTPSPRVMGSLWVKFYDDRCEGKAVMSRKHFTLLCHFQESMHYLDI